MAKLTQMRDVAGGNETTMRGQLTTANDGMGGGLAIAHRPLHFCPTWSASCIGSAPNFMFGPLQTAEFSAA